MTAQGRSHQSRFSLDDPAFGDEMQRRTWMEAHVAGYEVALLASVTVAAAMVWIGGKPLVWWSVAVIWIIGLGNIVALGHLRAAGMSDLPWRDRMRFWSFRFRLLLGAVWIVGLVRAYSSGAQRGLDDVSGSMVAGMIVGASVVIGALAVLDRRTKRQAERDLPEDDRFDD